MTEFLIDLAAFASKAAIIATAIGVVAFFIATLIGRRRVPLRSDGTLIVQPVNARLRGAADAIRRAQMDDKAFKAFSKARATEARTGAVYVIEFDGDISASEVDGLRRVISAIIDVAQAGEEVICKLQSPGGSVPGYGLAASQLHRLRQAGLKVTAAVDTVAASGGYMMAVVADEIVAAPFAIIGSIGVYMPVPNVHRLLREHGVDVQELTSGKYKRTVSLVGELSEEGLEKTQQMLDETHALFKAHVAQHRPGLDIEQVATGEHWYGQQALALGLVDKLMTSDDVIRERTKTANVYRVTFEPNEDIRGRLSRFLTRLAARLGV